MLELKTKNLIFIVIILLIILFFSFLNFKKEISIQLITNDEIKNIYEIKIFLSDNLNNNELIIKKNNEEFFLINKNNEEKYPINKIKLENMLTSFATKTKATLVSKNKFIKLKNETHFIFFSKNKKLISEFFLGDIDITGLNRFVKLTNGLTYKSKNIYGEALNLKQSDLLERQILKVFLQNQNAQMITLNQKHKVKNNSNKKQFEYIENILYSFQVLDILNNFTKPKTQSEITNLEINLGNTQKLSLQFYQLENTDYIVYFKNANVHYIASNYAVEKILSKIKIL